MDQSYKHPTAVQMASIPFFFEKRNMLVIAPTGSGKTLSYALPLLSLIKVFFLKEKRRGRQVGVKAFILAPSMELVV